MQQKARGAKWRIAMMLAVLVVAFGTVALMMVNIPAPQRTIEKQLDAKDFLEPKQP